MPLQVGATKVYGLGYSLLIFVYEKTDDHDAKTGRLDIQHVIFVEAQRTADFQMTLGLREILEKDANEDDLVAFLRDRMLPVDEIEATRLAQELLETKPEQGYLTISNALQWRLQYGRVACLLVCEMGASSAALECSVRDFDQPSREQSLFGYSDGMLIADARAYRHRGHLRQSTEDRPIYRWRSGVKHDCAPVMELERRGTELFNGLNEPVDIETEYLYPLLKGSAVARGDCYDGQRWLVVPQTHTNVDTARIKETAPRTWAYLNKHSDRLGRRASSIYRKRPQFSIFGVGAYTFSPWKVATCALYKRLNFSVIGPYAGRPVVFDDTTYHLSCNSETEARLIADLLGSDAAKEFFQAFIFWDAKRPVTIDLLSRLDLGKLAREVGCASLLLELRTNGLAVAASANAVDRWLF